MLNALLLAATAETTEVNAFIRIDSWVPSNPRSVYEGRYFKATSSVLSMSAGGAPQR